jgi:DNA end-binding protein Ku
LSYATPCKTKSVSLARLVMAHREHMIMLEPLGKGLLGTTLRFDYEVRSEKEHFSHIPSPRIGKDMISLASHGVPVSPVFR